MRGARRPLPSASIAVTRRISELPAAAGLISGTTGNGQNKPSLNDPRLKDGASLPSACVEEPGLWTRAGLHARIEPIHEGGPLDGFATENGSGPDVQMPCSGSEGRDTAGKSPRKARKRIMPVTAGLSASSFGTAGTVTTQFTGEDFGGTVLIQSDGDIL